MLQTIRTDRLRQLAAYIVSPERKHEWDFSHPNTCAMTSTRELFNAGHRETFNLDQAAVHRLFFPVEKGFDGSVLPSSATAEECAANILAFCDEVER